MQFLDVPEDADAIVSEFRQRFFDTELFFDPYAKDKFARYLFRMHETVIDEYTPDLAHRAVEEAQLFIEAAYACYDRTATESAAQSAAAAGT